MDVMLLWDFLPGLAVAAQVHRRFNSQVHFSSSLATKEFFLPSLGRISFDCSAMLFGW
jgi:hypothetical protein